VHRDNIYFVIPANAGTDFDLACRFSDVDAPQIPTEIKVEMDPSVRWDDEPE